MMALGGTMLLDEITEAKEVIRLFSILLLEFLFDIHDLFRSVIDKKNCQYCYMIHAFKNGCPG